MTDHIKFGTTQQPIEPINVPDQGGKTERFEDAGSIPPELSKAKASPFQAIKRFFSSIVQGIIYLGEKIGNVFSSAKKGEDHASRLSEIKNSNGSISAEAINNGTVKVQSSEAKMFNNSLAEAVTNSKWEQIPQEYLDVIKSTDEKYQKINSFYEPIQKSGSQTGSQVGYGVFDTCDAAEDKVSVKEFSEVVNRRALLTMLRMDHELTNDIISLSENRLSGVKAKSYITKAFLQLDEMAKKGDAEAIKLLNVYDNVNTKEDYDNLKTALKNFMKPKLELQEQIDQARKDLIAELDNKIKSNFSLRVNTDSIKKKIEEKMDAVTTQDKINEQKKAVSVLIDKFIEDRKGLLDEIDSLTTDEKIKQIRYTTVLRDEKPLKQGEMTKLQKIVDEISNDKTVQDAIKLATSKKTPDSKKAYDTIMALTSKILKNVAKLNLSMDGTDGQSSNTAFVLHGLIEKRPELRGLSKFMNTIINENGKHDGKITKANISDAPEKRQGGIAFTIAFSALAD